jgi:hypothetical protein
MPSILTPDHHDLLDEEAKEHFANVEQVIQEAEWYVADRYRSSEPGGSLWLSSSAPEGPVQLRGWAEDEGGTPDPSGMPSRLLDRLRVTIARLVSHWATWEQRQGVDSISQGNESVTYKEMPRVPSRIFAPLRPFDQRPPV